jgi:RNA polymerase sigma factor FliA
MPSEMPNHIDHYGVSSDGKVIGSLEFDLWNEWTKTKSNIARNELINLYIPYAKVIAAITYAKRIHNEVEFDEYLQLSRIGLLESIDRYDHKSGVQFKTYASYRMRGSILTGLEKLSEKNQQIAALQKIKRDRVSSAKKAAAQKMNSFGFAVTHSIDQITDISTDQIFVYLADVSMELALGVMLKGTGMINEESFGVANFDTKADVSHSDKIQKLQVNKKLHEIIDKMQRQERFVIKSHYIQEISFEEIGLMLNVKKSRISQIHRQALKNLKLLLQQSTCDLFI